MSTALGLASVTYILKDLLNDRLINDDVAAQFGTTVLVSSLSPGQVEVKDDVTPTQLNIFLYRVSANIGWNNVGYPSRNAKGELINNPPLALDLHYLLTAYGESELHADILLGYGMQLFHEHPVITRHDINNSLNTNKIGDAFPPDLRALSNSGLADQIAQIKITPEPFNTEELSKLWTAFQAKYRPCTAYVASVVLIESERPIRPVPPVQERTIYPLPFRQPIIEQILSKKGETGPILENEKIGVGDWLVIKGKALKSDASLVLITGQEFLFNGEEISETQASIELPDTLRAGAQGVQVVHQIMLGDPPEAHQSQTSNLFAFVLSPVIAKVESKNQKETETGAVDETWAADIEVTLSPVIHPGQKATLLLNEILPGAGADFSQPHLFGLPVALTAPTDTLTFPVAGLKPAEYLVRVQVDGAESPLFAADTDGGYDSPKITLP